MNNYRDYLSDWFALEKTVNQNFQKSINKNVFAYFINTANEFFKDSRNNSFSKMYYSLANDLYNEIKIKDINVFKNWKEAYKIKNKERRVTPKSRKRRYLK